MNKKQLLKRIIREEVKNAINEYGMYNKHDSGSDFEHGDIVQMRTRVDVLERGDLAVVLNPEDTATIDVISLSDIKNYNDRGPFWTGPLKVDPSEIEFTGEKYRNMPSYTDLYH